MKIVINKLLRRNATTCPPPLRFDVTSPESKKNIAPTITKFASGLNSSVTSKLDEERSFGSEFDCQQSLFGPPRRRAKQTSENWSERANRVLYPLENRKNGKPSYLRLHSTAAGGLNMCHKGLLHESQLVGM